MSVPTFWWLLFTALVTSLCTSDNGLKANFVGHTRVIIKFFWFKCRWLGLIFSVISLRMLWLAIEDLQICLFKPALEMLLLLDLCNMLIIEFRGVVDSRKMWHISNRLELFGGRLWNLEGVLIRWWGVYEAIKVLGAWWPTIEARGSGLLITDLCIDNRDLFGVHSTDCGSLTIVKTIKVLALILIELGLGKILCYLLLRNACHIISTTQLDICTFIAPFRHFIPFLRFT